MDFGLALKASREVVHADKAHDKTKVASTLQTLAFIEAPNNSPPLDKHAAKKESSQINYNFN